MKVIFIIALLVIIAVIAHIWQTIHADKAANVANGDTKFISIDKPTAPATPKQFGIWLISTGLWRRNRLKAKIKNV